jgi:hypothetical protein
MWRAHFLCCATASALAAALAACTPRYEGDYDGTASVSFRPDHAKFQREKFPVHVSVSKDSVAITGSPLTQCAPNVVEATRVALNLRFSSGRCVVHTDHGDVALQDGSALATLKGDDLTMSFNGEDVLSFEVRRSP